MVTKARSEIVRIPLATDSLWRDSNRDKDARLINCFVDTSKTSKKSWVVKRPGIRGNNYLDQPFNPIPAGEVRGYYNWHVPNGFVYEFVVIDDVLYELSMGSIRVLNTGIGDACVGWCEIDNGGIPYLFMCDGVTGYRIDDFAAVTIITDLDFPNPHVPTPVFIDGYVLLPRAFSQDIHNSVVDNVLSWRAGDFVTAEMYSDNVEALSKQNNQLIAFGGETCEFLYNASLTDGSPFARNNSIVATVGCQDLYSIAQSDKVLYFVGTMPGSSLGVWCIEGLQPKKISTEYVDRVLTGTNLNEPYIGRIVQVAGKTFYVLQNLFEGGDLTPFTLVYNQDEGMWSEWTDEDGNMFISSFFAGPDSQSFNYSNPWAFFWPTTGDEVYRDSVIDVNTNVTTYYDIPMEIYTPIIDFDTSKRKFVSNLNIIGDLQPGQTIDIRWSDDDYETWSSWHTINMDTRMFLPRIGSFRRRAFHIRYVGDTNCRLEALELEVTIGES
jgi:hypothetical protein